MLTHFIGSSENTSHRVNMTSASELSSAPFEHRLTKLAMLNLLLGSGTQGNVGSLLLATTLLISGLCFARNHLTQHNNTIAIHKGNTRETFAVLEAISDERL